MGNINSATEDTGNRRNMSVGLRKVYNREDISCLQSFAAFLQRFGKAPLAGIKYINANSEVIRVKKGTILVKAGESNSNVYFIYQGVVRGYMTNDKKDITTWIAEDGEMAATIRNFDVPLPSDEEIEVIEDAVLMKISQEVFDYVYDKYPASNKIGRLVISLNYREAEERAYVSRIPSAEGRYRRFIEYRGGLVNRIPLKYIASYLGMNLETLSRIRNKVK